MSGFLPEPHGQFVDVGAGDPHIGSNSFLFYRRGWTGLLVEANPVLVRRLRASRPRDSVVEALAGSSARSQQFFVLDPWQMSTTSEERACELQAQGHSLEQVMNLPVKPLSALGLTADPLEASVLFVDVEGADFDVLLGNDWKRFLPRVVVIEQLDDVPHRHEAESLLSDMGYVCKANACGSLIFVHERYLQQNANNP